MRVVLVGVAIFERNVKLAVFGLRESPPLGPPSSDLASLGHLPPRRGKALGKWQPENQQQPKARPGRRGRRPLQ